MKTDIILAGVGGQGILTIATVLGHAALGQNLYIKQAEVHGMSQRGGDVQSNLRLSSEPIASDLIPTGKADIIISLEPMEALRYAGYLSKDGWVVTNTKPFVNIDPYPNTDDLLRELHAASHVVAFDMDDLAAQTATARSANIVLLGAASPLIDIRPELIEQSIEAVFSSKGPRIVEANLKAFRAGRAQALGIIDRAG